MTQWTNLTTNFGLQIKDPSDDDLRNVLKKHFSIKDNEHPDAWLECGSDNGPLYSLSIFSSGYAIYTKYSDADMTDELEVKRIESVDEDKGFDLWKKLISDGDI